MNSKFRFVSLLWLIVCTCFVLPDLRAQTLDLNFPSADSTVNVIAHDGNYTYLGGQFRNVGLTTGYGVKLSTTSDIPNMSFPQVNNQVTACVADGSGGWYIAGVFTEVGGLARNGLAHILGSGTVDAAWDPGADQVILTLAVSGSAVYAGGVFSTIGGVSRYGIAKLDKVTGAVDAGWNANLGIASYISVITPSGSSVYVGGVFTTIGGQTRNNIAKLDTIAGNANTTWNPGADGQVRTIALNGADMYMGGDFSMLGAVSRNYLAKLDTVNGTADAGWNANVNDLVYAIVTSGIDMYIGGGFTSVGGTTRNYIAKLNSTTAVVDAGWNANANTGILSMAISGATVYAAGVFDSMGGQPTKYLTRLNTTTGAVDAGWKPSLNDAAYCLAISGTGVYAGGIFTMAKAAEIHDLARINNTTGVVDESWNPEQVNSVSAWAQYGSSIKAITIGYAGIYISSNGNVVRLDKVTGVIDLGWQARSDGQLDCHVSDGNAFYYGGTFTIAGTATARKSLASVGVNSPFVSVWNPNVTPNFSEVFALALDGPDIYAGGQFTGIGGGSSTNIARLNNTTGALKPFVSLNGASGYVKCIAITGSEMYLGHSYAATSLTKILMADRAIISTWAPNPDGAMAVVTTSGADVYAGGDFTTIGGQARNYLAKLNNINGAADASWNPDPDSTVLVLSAKDSFVYVGGMFSNIAGASKQGIARFKVPMPVTYPTWTGAVSSRWQDGRNWSTGVVPGLKDSVVILAGTLNAPGMDSATYTVKNFVQAAGQTITLGASGIIVVTGTFINNGTITGGGKVVLNGTAAQHITGAGTVSNLELNNSLGATIDTASTDILKVTGLITLTSGMLTTNNKLILKSTSPTATAMVGPVPSSGAGVSGKVVHERYLSTPPNGSGGRSWRLLTSPLAANDTNNSIFYNWQNNGVNDGTGIEFWSPSGTGAAGNGLTQGGVSSSLRSFDYVTDTYVPVTNTKTTMLFTGTQNNTFLAFVSGSYGSGNISYGAGATNADATGTLITGTQNYSFTAPSPTNIYYLMGNPYACPIDFDKVYNNTGTANINQKFWVIDPNLSNFGAYATVTYILGTYVSSSCNQDKYIQTGQGFFVEASTPNVPSTVAVEEDDKDTNPAHQANVMRTNGSNLELFRIKLYKNINSIATQLDGTVVAGHQSNNNAIDGVDGLKFGNFNENIGIYSSGKVLAVEARQLLDNNDTVCVSLGNMQQTTYQLVLKPSLNMSTSGLYATLIDNFTNTTTPVSLSAITTYNFTVTASAASTGTGRFKVVFNTITPLSLKFVNTSATKHGGKVDVQWTVASQEGITIYEVERSSDAKSFSNIATVQAGTDNTYSYADETPFGGNNYYRIKAVARSTNGVYSNIVRVSMNATNAELNAYPNPVKDGHLQVSVSNLIKGNYVISLYNATGQKVATKQVSYEAGNTMIEMDVNTLANGIYMMQLTNDSGEKIAEQKIVNQ